MTPLKQLVVWVIAQGGRVHRDAYRAQGIALGCPVCAENAAFGPQHPPLVRDGDTASSPTADASRAGHPVLPEAAPRLSPAGLFRSCASQLEA